jgi:hypothetical protein
MDHNEKANPTNNSGVIKQTNNALTNQGAKYRPILDHQNTHHTPASIGGVIINNKEEGENRINPQKVCYPKSTAP